MGSAVKKMISLADHFLLRFGEYQGVRNITLKAFLNSLA